MNYKSYVTTKQESKQIFEGLRDNEKVEAENVNRISSLAIK